MARHLVMKKILRILIVTYVVSTVALFITIQKNANSAASYTWHQASTSVTWGACRDVQTGSWSRTELYAVNDAFNAYFWTRYDYSSCSWNEVVVGATFFRDGADNDILGLKVRCCKLAVTQ